MSAASLVAVAAAAIVAGCGGSTADSSSGSPMTPGKAIFQTAGCSTCHTLADAGASGQTGPNLDYERPSKAAVAAQVRSGGGAMPSFQGRLSPDQIDTVAAYVASVAGKK